MISRRWTDKHGFRYYVRLYDKRTKKNIYVGTYPDLIEAQAGQREAQKILAAERESVTVSQPRQQS